MMKSVSPKKQRNARRDAPMHKRKSLMHVHVSPELRTKLGTSRRSMLIRKGDKVKITTGALKKKEGVVLEVNYSDLRLRIEGITRKNARGQEKLIPIQPSNVMIIDGDFSLKDRKAILERSGKKKAVAAKPAPKKE